MDNDCIKSLLADVKEEFGGRISTSTDFAKLSESIKDKIGQTLSDSTLKRIWGYIDGPQKHHQSSLDILSEYVGCSSYKAYRNRHISSSEFFAFDTIASSDLSAGDTVTVGWQPDRQVSLTFIGNNKYIVTDGGTSKLKKGDLIECLNFILGQPLFIGSVNRNGVDLQSYVAGKSKGLTVLKKSGK